MSSRSLVAVCAVLLLPLSARGDVVETGDGARLVGTVTGIAGGVLTMETAYAGRLAVQQGAVVSVDADRDLAVRFEDGATLTGRIETRGQGRVAVRRGSELLVGDIAELRLAWAPGESDPDEVRLQSKKAYRSSADLTAKDGNSDETGLRLGLEATIERPDDRIRYYAVWERNEQNGIKTADERKAGINYFNRYSERMQWYLRTEAEKDEFEDLSLRNTSTFGLARVLKDDDATRADVRLGLGYRFESYSNDSDDLSSVVMDAGASYVRRFGSWARLDGDLSYIPEASDFGNYRLNLDLGFEMPLGLSDLWSLRVGVEEDYNSTPAPGKEELDTTFYTRLVLTFD